MSPGRILFLQRGFPPTPGAAGAMLHELAGFLVGRGWQVQVVCSGETDSTTTLESIKVQQVKAPYQSQNLFVRALSMIRVRSALERCALAQPKPDLVVSLTDPPGLAITGARIARHHGAVHVHWSQDVYPEIAWQLGILTRNNLLARHLWSQSRRALRESAAVISISNCMTRILESRKTPPQKIQTVPNWTSVEATHEGDPKAIRDRLNLPPNPILLYAGNFGRAHEFQTLLLTAAAVPHWTFLLVGDGPRKTEIETSIQKLTLKNTRILPRQPASDYAQLRWIATAHCVTLDSRVAGCVMPSKIYSALPCGRPIVFIGPEASDAHPLATACGISVRNGEASSLTHRLTNWNLNEAEEWSRRARQLAADFTLEKRAAEIESVFYRALSGREMKPDSTGF